MFDNRLVLRGVSEPGPAFGPAIYAAVEVLRDQSGQLEAFPTTAEWDVSPTEVTLNLGLALPSGRSPIRRQRKFRPDELGDTDAFRATIRDFYSDTVTELSRENSRQIQRLLIEIREERREESEHLAASGV